MHYRRWRRHGNPSFVKRSYVYPVPVLDPNLHAARFWKMVRIGGPDDCWPWQGRGNYFSFGRAQNRMTPRRFAYILTYGGAPADCVMGSTCRNDLCVNPGHSRPMTPSAVWHRNIPALAAKAAQSHCIHGHAFNEANTMVRSNGTRACLTCARLRQRRKDGRLHITSEEAVKPRRKEKAPEVLSPLVASLLAELKAQ